MRSTANNGWVTQRNMEQDIHTLLQEQLKGLHLPEAVGWWPLAPGWWILIALSVGLLGTAIWWLAHYINSNRYRRQALSELQTAYNQWQEHQNNSLYIQAANAILKRTLYAAGDHRASASLTGQIWCKHLNTWSSSPLSEETQAALAWAGYQANPDIDVHQLNPQLTKWLKTHKKPQTLNQKKQREPNYA